MGKQLHLVCMADHVLSQPAQPRRHPVRLEVQEPARQEVLGGNFFHPKTDEPRA